MARDRAHDEVLAELMRVRASLEDEADPFERAGLTSLLHALRAEASRTRPPPLGYSSIVELKRRRRNTQRLLNQANGQRLSPGAASHGIGGGGGHDPIHVMATNRRIDSTNRRAELEAEARLLKDEIESRDALHGAATRRQWPVRAEYPVTGLSRANAPPPWSALPRVLYRLIAALARLAVRSRHSKDLEIIVLRHQLTVLRRPAFNDHDRSLLGAIAAALP